MLTTHEPQGFDPLPGEPREEDHGDPHGANVEGKGKKKGQGLVEYFLILVLVSILAMTTLFGVSGALDFLYRSISEDVHEALTPSPAPSPSAAP